MLRLLKQVIIALIFFTVIGSAIYFFSMRDDPLPAALPTVLISPLLVSSQKLLKVGDRDYDFLAEIKNPNFDFGATVFYELNLFGGTGGPAMVKTGSMSLLPGQSMFEIVSPIRTEAVISRAGFKITSVIWERLKEFIPQNLFFVKNQKYSFLPKGQGFSSFSGVLFNNSNFDFDRVDVLVVLYGSDGDILAVNKTDARTMLAKTERFFEVKWPVSFKGEVSRIEISVYTDIFKNSNFLKEHGTEERFQNFY
ncbi:MAG: hypothetical protein AAB338_00015 [Patescibacteria group bacterium]